MTRTETAAVSSHNEWDPLEETIVGVIDGAAVPPPTPMLRVTMPEEHWGFFQARGGQPFPPELIAAARRDLDGFVALLEREGVAVRRPEPLEQARPFSTPDWRSEGGLYAAMPRDLLLVIGNEIIEAPLAWRCRHYEIHAYRELLKDYFRQGARWVSAPRPSLVDAQFAALDEPLPDGAPHPLAVTEFEPTFDAADFIRCGRDLFVQLSHVTNRFGVEWLKSHLGASRRVHLVSVSDPHPMHIDATMLPLAPGRLLVNPERLPVVPELFRDWEILTAPPPQVSADRLLMSSPWVSMNVLSLDEKRVVVEQQETALIAALQRWGFSPLPCSFRAFNLFGGSFHCATLDVRRRGRLQSYFP